jgi:hypothetical protein
MRIQVRERFIRGLDRVVRPEFNIIGAPRPAYKVCVYVGVIAGVLLIVALGAVAGRPVLVVFGSSCLGIVVALAFAMSTKIITGAEQFTFYHYEIVVLGVVSGSLALAGLPLLPNLDLIILALGVADAGGRMGCLMAGCCHGRPHDWGVRYGPEHAAAGFESHLVGVRLFPIQIIESIWMFATVAVGSILFLTQPPGTALGWCVVTYGAGRFYMEFARGDRARPFLLAFSEGQWTSFVLISAALAGEQTGLLPFVAWHAFAEAAIIVTVIGVVLVRRLGKTGKHGLLHPEHLKEFAEAVERVSNVAAERASIPRWNTMPANIHLETTSLGIQISASQIASPTGSVCCYALSRNDREMTLAAAKILAGLIIRLRGLHGANRIVTGRPGVFHLLIQNG